LDQKVPFRNDQYSFAAGGPIVHDRLHYFGNCEYDRTPLTTIANTPYPAFNISLSGKETVKMGGGRADYQLSNASRLMIKGDGTRRETPFNTLTSNHPAQAVFTDEKSWALLGTLTRVVSNSSLRDQARSVAHPLRPGVARELVEVVAGDQRADGWPSDHQNARVLCRWQQPRASILGPEGDDTPGRLHDIVVRTRSS
jgi:hypothetical protein